LAAVLFREGRALLTEGKVREACLKLEESQHLDPSGGTILNLALCHERQGALARAWTEFNEAMAFARKDGRGDREQAASTHARALEPRLSTLTITVPASSEVEGLRIERDGHEIGRGAWSIAIPIDPGEHVVRATAPGRQPFTAPVGISKESEARTVEIPVLQPSAASVVTPPPSISSPRVAPTLVPGVARAPEAPGPRFRWAAIGTAGVGGVLLGGAGYALVAALAKKEASKSGCSADNLCNAAGQQDRRDAVSRGNLATILSLGGGVLVATGATLFFLGRSSSTPVNTSGIRTGFLFGATPGMVVTGFEGGFR
ncbi:MAG TPA: hypothetical protein VF348_01125, partial [Usitatibacter sp.]